MRFQVLVRDGDGFLHHVAQVAGHGHDALAAAHGALHEEDLAAHLGPGQARHHAGGFVAFLNVVEIGRETEVGLDFLGTDDFGQRFFERDFLGGQAGELGNLLVQAADARFAGVLVDDRVHRLVGELELGLFQAVCLALLRDEIALRNGGFFLGQVT